MNHTETPPPTLARKLAVLVGLGFASGLPGAWSLLGSPIQAWLGEVGASVQTIGLFGLIWIPFAFNFVWAPLLDRWAPPGLGRLGRRRGWLLVIQALLIVAIAVMAVAGPSAKGDSLLPLAVTGLIVAFFAATQDVVADAYRTDILADRELGHGAAAFVNGYRVAMLAGSGGALLLGPWIGWHGTYGLLAALMGVGIMATLVGPMPPHEDPAPATLAQSVIDPVADFFRRHGPRGFAVLALIVCFKLPDALARAMTMPLLQKALGFELAQIAWIREWLGLLAAMLGAVAGGVLVARMGLRRSLGLLVLLQMLSNLGFCVLVGTGRNVTMMAAVVGIENFCGGMVTAGFIAFLMSRCRRQYSATQYALFTSLSFLTATISSALSGFGVAQFGYGWFFAATVAMGLPALVLLPLIGDVARDGP